ncbi:MAG: holo-ACP synthase, partial [Endomicrobia bacterium]|nr:holo-ACP synthase [Endomicrobiia bacterium]
QKTPYQHFAARFAAKEAVIKSFGLGILNGLRLKDIEVINDKNGKPCIKLNNKLAFIVSKKVRFRKIHLSLSHFNEYAVAFVVVE